ncbi:hypothetical protein Y032_0643g1061 [Ancylostoma ceylanicum]|uniref:UPAR/Ly6 domain-containing protein n=1 Tax=Ancylostoma ceylanicum TaxID=53326 RepID=A0A016WJE4_9BILA|nr:hypothetical protein Y032_0643g1061 [Ancylostoma ceylanicum]
MLLMLIRFSLFLPLVYSLECYDFEDRQIGGKIIYGAKRVVECTNPEFCLSVYKEGNEENVYWALCANNSNVQTTCQSAGCSNSHGGGISTRKCCCDSALCNSSRSHGLAFLPFVVMLYLSTVSWRF